MNTPKQLFNKNKDLRKKLIECTSSEWFSEALIYARGEMLDANPTAEELAGVKKFLDTLFTMGDAEPPERPTLTTGLLPEPNLSRNKVEPKE